MSVQEFALSPEEVEMMAADPQCLRRLVKLTMGRERCAELHAEAERIEDEENEWREDQP